MVETVGGVNVDIRANLAPLQQGLQRANRETQVFDRRARQAFTGTNLGAQRASGSVRVLETGLSRSAQQARNLEASATSSFAVVRRLAASLGIAFSAGLIGRRVFQEFMEFDQALTRIHTLVGVQREQIQAWRRDIMELSTTTGRSATDLARGMFFITSAGLRGSTALQALEASAKAASIGLGDTRVVADLVTSAMNAYGAEVLNANKATSILVAAVREGKAEAEDLASSLGRVLPVASEMGVTFDQVGAAVAAMTRTGTEANQAATALRSVMLALLRPTEQSRQALEAMGTSAAELRQQIREEGLLVALQNVRDLTRRFGEEAVGQVFPNVRALIGILDLLGANAEENARIFQRMADGVDDIDKEFQAWTESAEGRYILAMRDLNAIMRDIGQITIPALVEVISAFADDMSSAAAIIDRSGKVIEEAIQQIGVAAGVTNTEIDKLLERLDTLVEFGKLLARGPLPLIFEGINRLLDRAEESLGMNRFENIARAHPGGAPLERPTVVPTKPEEILTLSTDPDKINQFERAVKLIQDRTAAIQLETDIIELNTAQQEAARVEMDLLNAAREASIELGSDELSLISSLAEGYGLAVEQLEDLEESINKAREAQEFFGDVIFRSLEGLIVRGQSASDVMRNLMQAIASAALQASLLGTGPLSGVFGGGSGLLGGLLGGLFASAKGNAFQNGQIVPFQRGGLINQPIVFPMRNGLGQAGESGTEAILPLKRDSMGNLGVRSEPVQVHVTVGIDVDSSGNLMPFVSDVATNVLSRDGPQIAARAFIDARRRSVKGLDE